MLGVSGGLDRWLVETVRRSEGDEKVCFEVCVKMVIAMGFLR